MDKRANNNSEVDVSNLFFAFFLAELKLSGARWATCIRYCVYISTSCSVMLCVTSSPIISFWSLYFPPWLTPPQYPLTPFIASNTCRFSTAPTSERTDLPPSTAPQATTDIWHVRSSGKEPMFLPLSLEKKAHLWGLWGWWSTVLSPKREKWLHRKRAEEVLSCAD